MADGNRTSCEYLGFAEHGLETGNFEAAEINNPIYNTTIDRIIMPFVENTHHIMSMLEVILNRNLKNAYL